MSRCSVNNVVAQRGPAAPGRSHHPYSANFKRAAFYLCSSAAASIAFAYNCSSLITDHSFYGYLSAGLAGATAFGSAITQSAFCDRYPARLRPAPLIAAGAAAFLAITTMLGDRGKFGFQSMAEYMAPVVASFRPSLPLAVRQALGMNP